MAPTIRRAPTRSLGALACLELEVGRFRYVRYLNVTIGVWEQQATLEAAQRIARMSQRISKQCPTGHSSVTFIMDGAPAPTEEAQQELAKLYDPRISQIACMGIVIAGSGFWASRMRSMVTSLRISVPGALKLGIHESYEDLLGWFPAEHMLRTGVTLELTAFRQALQACRDQGTRDG